MSGNWKMILQKGLKTLAEKEGFDKVVGKITILSAGNGKCSVEMMVEPSDVNRQNTLHGGLSSMLVDTVTTLALLTSNNMVPGVSTHLNMQFLRSAKLGETIIVDAETVKIGKTLAVLKAEIKLKHNSKILVMGHHTKFIG